ncbi:hypothetical protein RND81_07G153500 [Saponaria officinalis]|uniref:RING-CH-type domain-containing protein n=1 Tax=Saponaria officinalis TaxID=3572 RepID=A0AAW1JSB0_SAPOF
MNMGEKTINGFNFIEEQKMGCSTNDECVPSQTIIQIPKTMSVSSSFEPTDVASNSANHSSDLEDNCGTENAGFDKESSWVVNVECEDEKICRICHLNYSEQPFKVVSSTTMSKVDVIMLGCGCKGELSLAHLHCAEAWFKLKGNRVCEICGQTANNVKGIGNGTFMEEWKERRPNGNAQDSSEIGAEEGCWHGQPLCNFLTACLVMAFIIPWFFRINFW